MKAETRKSDLYWTIYHIAIYCLAASASLLLGTGLLLYCLKQMKGEVTLLWFGILAAFGVGLVIFSIVVWVVFYKKYHITLSEEREEDALDELQREAEEDALDELQKEAEEDVIEEIQKKEKDAADGLWEGGKENGK